MGVYFKSSLWIIIVNGEIVFLCDVIEKNKIVMLGEVVVNCFGELLFLFKVLCVV